MDTITPNEIKVFVKDLGLVSSVEPKDMDNMVREANKKLARAKTNNRDITPLECMFYAYHATLGISSENSATVAETVSINILAKLNVDTPQALRLNRALFHNNSFVVKTIRETMRERDSSPTCYDNIFKDHVYINNGLEWSLLEKTYIALGKKALRLNDVGFERRKKYEDLANDITYHFSDAIPLARLLLKHNNLVALKGGYEAVLPLYPLICEETDQSIADVLLELGDDLTHVLKKIAIKNYPGNVPGWYEYVLFAAQTMDRTFIPVNIDSGTMALMRVLALLAKRGCSFKTAWSSFSDYTDTRLLTYAVKQVCPQYDTVEEAYTHYLRQHPSSIDLGQLSEIENAILRYARKNEVTNDDGTSP